MIDETESMSQTVTGKADLSTSAAACVHHPGACCAALLQARHVAGAHPMYALPAGPGGGPEAV